MIKTLTIRGLKTAWLSKNPEHDTIFMPLHGFPDNPFSWKPQMDYFEKKYHIIAPYIRGTHPSAASKNLDRYRLDAIALDHLEILKKEGNKPVILLGHDLGSLYAWHLAPLLGERLKALIIINGGHMRQATHRLKNATQVRKSWYMFLSQVPGLAASLVKTIGPYLLKKFKEKNGVPPELVMESCEAHKDAIHSVKQYQALARDFIREMKNKSHFKLKAPVLQISSLDDFFVIPASLAELKLVAENPTARMVKGKHWLMQEQPELVNRLIEKFILKLNQ